MPNNRRKRSLDPLAPNKMLGQNFLINTRIVERIVKAAQVVPGDTVLEIGPGKGVLTHALVAAGARVFAVEKDARMAHHLLTQPALAGVHIITGDIMRVFGEVSAQLPSYKIIANIPYNITSHLISMVLTASHPPTTTTLMVQKEIADRICRPDKQSLLALSVACYARARYECTVARGNFSPIPQVDSAVIMLTRGGYIDDLKAHGYNIDEYKFFALLKLGFSSRRKQLGGLLRLRFPVLAHASVWAEAALHPHVRAEDLSLDDWWRLYCLVYSQ